MISHVWAFLGESASHVTSIDDRVTCYSRGAHFSFYNYSKYFYNLHFSYQYKLFGENKKKINFNLLKNHTKLPYKDKFFDTAIVNWVYHHIDKKDLILITKELNRVALRRIIEEDVDGNFSMDLNYDFFF